MDHAADFANGLLAIQAALGGIAGIALVTGGLGIANIGLASVRERVQEIGIRRAFGATRGQVFTTILLESAIITVLAGVIGLLMATLTLLALPSLLASVAPFTGLSVSFPIGAFVLGFALSLALGLVAGLIPARRATVVDVVRAIRY